ncbi:MAG: PASTA domain-containing protein [Gemmatimonas sp.]
MAKRRTTNTTLRTWLIRAAISIAIGIVAGFGLGAVAVRVLQPPVTVSVDPGADSTRKPRGPVVANEEPAAEPEKPKNGIVVPQLIGMEEGDARQAIVHAGFTIGSVTFKAGPPPMGNVVASFPVPGEAVVLPAMVNLILSDGKGRADSAAVPPPQDDNS